ncbi:hypothetical protein, partial [Peloplasma aerotolerans]
NNKHFTLLEFSTILFDMHDGFFKSRTQCELITNVVLYLMDTLVTNHNFNSSRFLEYNTNTEKYSIKSIGYLSKRDELVKTSKREFHKALGLKQKLFLRPNVTSGDKMRSDTLIVMAQIFELLGISKYSIKSGDRPEFFMRVNSVDVLERMTSQNYQSGTVDNINQLHNNSIRIMQYFFTRLNTDYERWNLIERYFLGEEIITND